MSDDYTLNWSSPLKAPFVLRSNTIDTTTTSLTLTGKGVVWGERVQENLLHLLETFSNNDEPLHATVGQAWYDTKLNQFKLYTRDKLWVVVWPHPTSSPTSPVPTSPVPTSPVPTSPVPTSPVPSPTAPTPIPSAPTPSPTVPTTPTPTAPSFTPVFISAAYQQNPIQQGSASSLFLTFTGLEPGSFTQIPLAITPSAGLSGASGSFSQLVTANSSGVGVAVLPYTGTAIGAQSTFINAAGTGRTATVTVVASAVFSNLYFSSSFIRSSFPNSMTISFTGMSPGASVPASIMISPSDDLIVANVIGDLNTLHANSSGNYDIIITYRTAGTSNGHTVYVTAFGTTRVAGYTTFDAGN